MTQSLDNNRRMIRPSRCSMILSPANCSVIMSPSSRCVVIESVITMSLRENKRAWVLGKVERGEVTAGGAGEVMGIGERQVRRLLARYREGGPAALVHGNRGRKPKHAVSSGLKAA